MDEININNIKYKVIENVKEALEIELLNEKLTDFFHEYDYIVGDWAYGKLRIKGFNKQKNKNFNKYNDIKNLATYIKNNCAHGCKWFQIERIGDWKHPFFLL